MKPIKHKLEAWSSRRIRYQGEDQIWNTSLRVMKYIENKVWIQVYHRVTTPIKNQIRINYETN